MSSSPASAQPATAASSVDASLKPFSSLFQDFEETADGSAGPSRLAALREELERLGVEGYVIPRADAHQNEYVPPGEERLAWLTGFTGSAGLLIVLKDKAALFVDGRYTLQAAQQVDPQAFTVVPLADISPEAYLEAHLGKGATLAYDPWRTTLGGREKLVRAVANVGGILVALEEDPIARLWTDRPAPALAPARLLDPAIAGATPQEKLAQVKAALGEAKVDGALISDPHATCWLFNLRGSDVAHTPIALAWSLVSREGKPVLFIAPEKLSPEITAHLAEVADILSPEALETRLAAFAEGRDIRVDQATAPVRLADVIERAGGRVRKGQDPIALPKARKNAAEIAGMRAAHLRDGAALVRFLHWFDGAAQGITEIDAVEALETFRRASNVLSDVSFPTIAGAGENGAIVHYRVTRSTNRALREGELFLIDSGAQYPDGTTDVTRTLAVGAPTAEMKARYTLVLKGHVALSRAVFPKGVSGAQLDPLARQYLWAAGLDFDHGTGHGVGAGLSVHEGPARISKLGHVPLEAGMILSNEPGYYKAGAYGIRIENLILVADRQVEGAEKPCLAFETLTLAPYDRRLIETALLSPEERTWIDAYHQEVAKRLSPLLDEPARAWLQAATAALP